MPSRRNFIKQTSLLSGALLCKGASFLYAADVNKFIYTSNFFKIALDPNKPVLTDFGVDSLGGAQFDINPLLTATIRGSYSSRIKGTFISYSKNEFPGKPCWKIKCHEQKFIIDTKYIADSTETDPFSIIIAQQVNHATALGILTEGSRLKFPCLLHLPDKGTFRVHCSDPEVTLFYDAYRFHAQGDKGIPFVQVDFMAANSQHKNITYTLEVVSIYPDINGVAKDPRFEGVRRNFINIFQLNPRVKVLANNSASDPCAFTLYLYAEIARRTPKLADGLTAMDLIRSSVDVYLGGMKGYGQVGFYYNNKYGWLSRYDSSDSSPSLVIAACYYIIDSNDTAWASKNYQGIKIWADKMIATDTNHDGFIEYGHTGNSGSSNMKPFQRPANWWDSIGFGHDDAYSNALAYRAVTLLSKVGLMIDKTEDSAYYSMFATNLKRNYFTHFCNPETGILAGWKSADGKLHDYYFTFVNAVAVCYGLLSIEQGKQVMQKLLQKMQEVGYTNFKLGLPGNLIPIPPQDYAHHDKRWGYGIKPDGSDGFQIYENGGASGCYAYFTIKALYNLGMRKEADAIFLPMMEGFKEGGFDGYCDNSSYTKDWKTWNGQCWGYEGFLVDNYLPLLAIYDWKA